MNWFSLEQLGCELIQCRDDIAASFRNALNEQLDERGLADPRLASDKHELSFTLVR